MDVREVITDNYAIYQDDCLEVMKQLPDDSIGLSIYSPPFATAKGGALYHYSSSPRDLSNSRSYIEFFKHYDLVIRDIERLTKPGRLTAVHCMDVPSGNTGLDHLIDFPGHIIEQHVKCRNQNCKPAQTFLDEGNTLEDWEFERRKGFCGHGWFEWVGRYHVWKEPLAVRNRTMAKRLAHQTIVEDSTKAGLASADYLLAFRKKGINQEPVANPRGLLDYAGETKPPANTLPFRGYRGKQINNIYSHWIWRQYADSNWYDVRIDRVLPFRESKDPEDERHVHPLQLDVIERGIILWSNPGDTVLSPFMGVGSEVYGAVVNERKAIGIELKPSFFRQAILNLQSIEQQQDYEHLNMLDLLAQMENEND